MANIVYIATSLDGYIADKNGGIDWLTDIPNPANSDYGYSEFINRIDGIIMGRNTFEKVLSFGDWPYTKKVFILSNSIKKVPDNIGTKAKIISGPLTSILEKLKSESYNNLYIDGGKVIQSFLKEGLIDEIIITRIPILLGDGIPLFGKLINPIRFAEVKTEILNKFLVKSYYKIIQ